jgi:hypothetical protein
MSKTILVTLNNSGNDPGPYNLTLIDGAGNQTVWPSNPVTKAQLIAGYQMIVPNLIVKVKVQSKTCTTYVELTIPTTQCPCRVINFTQGSYRFFTCGSPIATDLTVTGGVISYCINTLKTITKISGTGNYTDTNQCCTPGVNPVPTPTTTTSTTTSTTTAGPTTTTTSSTTTSTTSSTTSTSTTIEPSAFNIVYNKTSNGYTLDSINVNGFTPTVTSGTIPMINGITEFNTLQIGTNETLNIVISLYSSPGCITVTDSAGNILVLQSVLGTGLYIFNGLVINNTTPVQISDVDGTC